MSRRQVQGGCPHVTVHGDLEMVLRFSSLGPRVVLYLSVGLVPAMSSGQLGYRGWDHDMCTGTAQ
eukprot:15354698-Ditylum_brightwellii.AAC.1